MWQSGYTKLDTDRRKYVANGSRYLSQVFTYGHGSLGGEGEISGREFALPQLVLFVLVGGNFGGCL
jgi:hypothetical protein